MVAIAIFSIDPVWRGGLERLLRQDPAITIVGLADDPSALQRLIQRSYVDAVLADAPPPDDLSGWRTADGRTAFVVLLEGSDPEAGIDALAAGAGAVLPRAAGRDEIMAAIKAVTNGLAVVPRALVASLLEGAPPADALAPGNDASELRLTPRELEVLAAMADGASNKAIARRLNISFHTAKFHVAAILSKLDADSRTEAVTRAAQLGLVML
ncbi:MAG TPA: response regulator transcription factor [Xanthobacteraceae bacterium]|jgi:DNA-binding NarL/FixJ family response regulator